MATHGKGEAFLRQLSAGDEACGRGSGRWRLWSSGNDSASDGGDVWRRVETGEAMLAKKRVMVVIDNTARAKQAMMWALTHVTNRGDLLTLLHVVAGAGEVPNLADTLRTLCKACRPEVEVEALVIQGPKLGTVLSQVRKLEASVLVLGQSAPSPFCCLFSTNDDDFVEDCLNKAGCLAVAVRKQSNGLGGYLVSTRWQKNFWLLA